MVSRKEYTKDHGVTAFPNIMLSISIVSIINLCRITPNPSPTSAPIMDITIFSL